jgi:O-antigen/teichoic acid export membrane protein
VLSHNTAFSGILMVLARLISRVMDFGTLLILARLLSPSDFGLVAIAMTIVLVLEAALELPLSQALVRLPEIKESYYHTAFSLGLLRGVLLCAIVCAAAVPFANFYHHAKLVPLIQVLSIAPAARGLLNPRMAAFAKALNFKYEFYFELTGKAAAFIVGATAAWLIHNYWAIVLCTVTTPLVIAALSYIFFPFRPRLTLADWRIFADFLGWVSLSQILLAINWQSDQLLLGKLMRTSELGLFSAANNVTNIPVSALFTPLLRPLLSAFTMVKDDVVRLRTSYQRAASAVVTVGLPLMVGQSAVAGPTVRILLGEKWAGAIPMVHWLALSLIPMLFGVMVTPLGMALNETKQLVWRNLFQMLIKLPFVIAGALLYGFYGVIAARLISEAITAIYCMAVVRRLVGSSIRSQLMHCSRSVIATAVMAAGLAICAPYLIQPNALLPQLIQLASTAALGAAVYAGCLILLWRLADMPPGIETTALQMAQRFRRQMMRPASTSP